MTPIDDTFAPINDAFTHAVAAIEDAWERVRETYQHQPRPRVDTLSTSLSDPQAHAVELVLNSAAYAITGASHRDAVVSVVLACHAMGLISQTVSDRLIGETKAP